MTQPTRHPYYVAYYRNLCICLFIWACVIVGVAALYALTSLTLRNAAMIAATAITGTLVLTFQKTANAWLYYRQQEGNRTRTG